MNNKIINEIIFINIGKLCCKKFVVISLESNKLDVKKNKIDLLNFRMRLFDITKKITRINLMNLGYVYVLSVRLLHKL